MKNDKRNWMSSNSRYTVSFLCSDAETVIKYDRIKSNQNRIVLNLFDFVFVNYFYFIQKIALNSNNS